MYLCSLFISCNTIDRSKTYILLCRSVDMLYIEVKLCTSGHNDEEEAAFLEIEAGDTVTQVKEKVLAELSLGLLPNNYQLYHNDKQLPDDEYLIDNNVQDFDSLELKCIPSNRKKEGRDNSCYSEIDVNTRRNNGNGSMMRDSSNGNGNENDIGGGSSSADSNKAISGGRRGVYNYESSTKEAKTETQTQTEESSGELLLGRFKSAMRQLSSVGFFCCLQRSDFDDDDYEYDHDNNDPF
jgi:hypothetical protein